MSSADPERTNPFPGLRPFEESEDDVFFGRDAQIDDLVGRLRRRRFIAVVGTSGSGKSSLVRAGLLPALYGGFMTGAGSRWRVATLRPGSAPIANLAQALDAAGLAGASDTPQDVRVGLARAELDRGSLGLVELLRASSVGRNENVLILVDQFEELFRFQQENPNESAAFVKLLLAASESEYVSAYVVVTMRSDFLGECAQFEKLPETINDGVFLVPRMSWDQLRHTIEGPLHVAGTAIAPNLVTRLLNDLGDNPDQLPVLQHALMRTWDLRPETSAPMVLTLDDYIRTGGLENALSLHGDAVLDTLDAQDRIVAEKLFKCLTELGGDNRGIRRPARLGDIRAITGASLDRLCHVIEAFRSPGCSFLTPATGALTENVVIDIAHEGLMRIWQRLAAWVAEEARSAQEYRRLATAANLYAAGEAALWRDPELQHAENWRRTAAPNAAWAHQVDPRLDFTVALEFLDRSVKERRRQRSARTRTIRLVGGGLAAIAVILAVATSMAFTQRDGALHAQSRFLARAAQKLVDQGDAVTGMLLALEALPTTIAHPNRPFVLDAEYALENASSSQQELVDMTGHTDVVYSANFSPDGRRVVSSSRDGTARIWNAGTGAQVAVLTSRGNTIGSASFSPDGRRVVTASFDETVRIWNAQSGAPIAVLRGHTGPVFFAAFSPDGRRIVSASRDQTVRVWDAASGAQLGVLSGHSGDVVTVEFSPDGRRIVSASWDKTVRIWDARSGAQVGLLRLRDAAESAMFSPDSRRVVTASGKTVTVWDAHTLDQLLLMRPDTPVSFAAFSPDGRRIVTGSTDRTVRIWDALNGDQLAVLSGHEDAVFSAVFSSDGRRILSASADDTVRIWAVTSRAQVIVLRQPDGVNTAVFSPDGRRIVSSSFDDTVRIWNAGSGAQLAVLYGHTGTVNSAAYSPDGTRVVSASSDKTVRIWNARNGAPIAVLRGHEGPVESAAFSPDGRRIVSTADDKTIRIWDAASGAQIAVLRGHDGAVNFAAFSPDGRSVVSASEDFTVRTWDVATGAQKQVSYGFNAAAESAVYSPDGARVASASGDGTIRISSAANLGTAMVLRGHQDTVRSVAFSPDGQRVISSSDDRTVRIWDAGTGSQIAVFHADGPIYSAEFSPDGRRIVAASDDKTVRVWILPLRGQDLIDAARKAVPHQLSSAERAAEFLPPR